jgi:hypothetical protein
MDNGFCGWQEYLKPDPKFVVHLYIGICMDRD